MNPIRLLWATLTRVQRRDAMVLLGSMLIGTLLETLGIGLMVPMLELITTSDIVARYPILEAPLRRFGNPPQETVVLAGMLLLVVVYAVKTWYVGYLSWRQFKFLADVQVAQSQRLFKGYVARPYAFHLQRNSAELIRNVISEVAMMNTGLTSALGLLAEGSVVVALVVLLLMAEPAGALMVVTVFTGVGWAFHRVTKHRILQWGVARQRYDLERQKHLMQGLGGIKEVKLLGRETNFLGMYHRDNDGRARAEQRQLTLQALPRLVLELLVVTGLAVLVLAVIAQGKSLQTLVPTMGLFAVAAFRLMPSATRIISFVQSVRFVTPSIRVLYDESRGLTPAAEPPAVHTRMAFESMVTIEHITFQYASAAMPALRDVSLTIPRGTSVGFLGGSGAGKSTLVDIILGLLVPTQGRVLVDGVDIQSNARGWQDQIGYVPQAIYLTDDSLRRNVAFGLADDEIVDAAVKRAVHAAQLDEFVNELPDGLETIVGERGVRISGGQRQRIAIARALYHDPPVLVLDEATSALDIATERDIMDTVRALHGIKTLIIVAHRLNTIQHCDRLYRLSGGRLVEEGDSLELLGKAATPA